MLSTYILKKLDHPWCKYIHTVNCRRGRRTVYMMLSFTKVPGLMKQLETLVIFFFQKINRNTYVAIQESLRHNILMTCYLNLQENIKVVEPTFN